MEKPEINGKAPKNHSAVFEIAIPAIGSHACLGMADFYA